MLAFASEVAAPKRVQSVELGKKTSFGDERGKMFCEPMPGYDGVGSVDEERICWKKRSFTCYISQHRGLGTI